MNKLPKVALIGRANVGKSTLFNTLLEQKKAIVSNIAGTTRDRHYANISWNNFDFTLIDTGGLDIVHAEDIEKEILKQTNLALKEAALILFLVDVKSGLMPQDKAVASRLKKSAQPIILTVNKADTLKLKNSIADFYKLGLGEPMAISALNGTGTGDLLDKIVTQLKSKTKILGQRPTSLGLENSIRLAIIGKPNVGKSTLVNAIVDEERMITSALPYTTRDAQDIEVDYHDQAYTLIDTAGIRRIPKIKDRLEKFSVNQALGSLAKANVALLITDVSEPLNKQDKILAEKILNSRTSLILVANKWDKIPDKTETTINKFSKYYQGFFPFLTFAPIIFISALEKTRAKKVLELAQNVYQQRCLKLTDEATEKFFREFIKNHKPPHTRGTKKPFLYGLKQVGIDPPQFELVKDGQSLLADAYLRFMEKQLREHFGFLGTPIIIKVRKIK